ncbi:MAG: HIT domain-containing protein [Desulfurococcales archaeon]|nr:HIT domain-containing protein [Desulfurococcales archaeon]
MSEKKEILWAPWRMKYIKDTVEKEEQDQQNECILCRVAKEADDKRNLILHRGKRVYIIMNKYPYNTGHLMIVPYRHIPSIENLDPCELLELSLTIKHAVEGLREAIRPDGFNIGVNIGRAAGAGIYEHVHVHIVPRWVGDSNFMPVIGGVKVIPQSLDETYSQVKPYIERKMTTITEEMRGC